MSDPKSTSSLRIATISKAALALVPSIQERITKHAAAFGTELKQKLAENLALICAGFVHDALVEQERVLTAANHCPHCGAPRPPKSIDPRREPE